MSRLSAGCQKYFKGKVIKRFAVKPDEEHAAFLEPPYELRKPSDDDDEEVVGVNGHLHLVLYDDKECKLHCLYSDKWCAITAGVCTSALAMSATKAAGASSASHAAPTEAVVQHDASAASAMPR